MKKYILLFMLIVLSSSALAYSEFNWQGSVTDLSGEDPTDNLDLKIEVNDTDGTNIYTESFSNTIQKYNNNSIGFTFDVVVGREHKNLSLVYNKLYFLCNYIDNEIVGNCFNWTAPVGDINSTLYKEFMNISGGKFTGDVEVGHNLTILGTGNLTGGGYACFDASGKIYFSTEVCG